VEVRLAVHNTGYLPSYVTKRALERKMMRGVVYEIELPAGASSSRARRASRAGSSRAREQAYAAGVPPNLDLTGDRGQCEWTVRAPAGRDSGSARATTAPGACAVGTSARLSASLPTEVSHARLRPAAVSGSFLPRRPARARRRDRRLSRASHAAPKGWNPPKAIIAPHAGYMYSVAIAASIYARSRRCAARRAWSSRPAHRVYVRGARPAGGRVRIPAGHVVDPSDRGWRAAFVEVSDAPRAEHSLEVHLRSCSRCSANSAWCRSWWASTPRRMASLSTPCGAARRRSSW
jgi:hypothetical protein